MARAQVLKSGVMQSFPTDTCRLGWSQSVSGEIKSDIKKLSCFTLVFHISCNWRLLHFHLFLDVDCFDLWDGTIQTPYICVFLKVCKRVFKVELNITKLIFGCTIQWGSVKVQHCEAITKSNLVFLLHRKLVLCPLSAIPSSYTLANPFLKTISVDRYMESNPSA